MTGCEVVDLCNAMPTSFPMKSLSCLDTIGAMWTPIMTNLADLGFWGAAMEYFVVVALCAIRYSLQA